MKGIIAKKVGMTSIFLEGQSVPVTVLEAGPCKVVDIKDNKRNGYNAISLGFGIKSLKKTSKAMRTIFEKSGSGNPAIVREFRDMNFDGKVGDEIKASIFQNNEYVDIVGTSKGKGFQGVMKRHNFAGGPASHGATKFHRRPGSIGCLVAWGRVFPGKKMPGHLGNERVTIQNLKIVKIDEENNLIAVKGAVPGASNGYLLISSSIKKRGK
jgi:large subunit ribosomal protein L3